VYAEGVFARSGNHDPIFRAGDLTRDNADHVTPENAVLERVAESTFRGPELLITSTNDGRRTLAKRVIDIIGAAILLILSSPLFLLIALFVYLSDPGPILFRQQRIGMHGNPFRIMKFRTMFIGAESRLVSDTTLYGRYLENDHKLSCDEDPRVTRLGRLLRTTSLDELPQLLNVLSGSMSLVGPRPVLRSEIPKFGDLADTVLAVRPGMTGLWQVSGRSRVAFPDRAFIEAQYASTWSLFGDVRILVRTIRAVVLRTGAH
jgi:exopolysaccharide production protein ExoY